MCIFVKLIHWYYICKIMINRINLILRAKNITARQFAEEIGIQPSGMSHILGGRNNPSLDFVSKVLRRYPEIDANWLLLGKGEMYTSDMMSGQPAMELVSPIEEPMPERKSEPSLFDERPTEVPSEAVPSQNPMYQQDDIQEEEIGNIHSQTDLTSIPRSASMEETRRIERILLIYSDNTYKELCPQE